LAVLLEELSAVCDTGTLASLEVKLRNIDDPNELKCLNKLVRSDFNFATFKRRVDETMNGNTARL
jgi:hypothetical protein